MTGRVTEEIGASRWIPEEDDSPCDLTEVEANFPIPQRPLSLIELIPEIDEFDDDSSHFASLIDELGSVSCLRSPAAAFENAPVLVLRPDLNGSPGLERLSVNDLFSCDVEEIVIGGLIRF